MPGAFGRKLHFDFLHIIPYGGGVRVGYQSRAMTLFIGFRWCQLGRKNFHHGILREMAMEDKNGRKNAQVAQRRREDPEREGGF
jgi:hypothetical protein